MLPLTPKRFRPWHSSQLKIELFYIGEFMSRFYRTASVSSWTGRIAAIMAAAVAVTAAGVLPADASVPDDAPPVVLSKWISHQSIDVIDGPAQVTVRLEVQDSGGSGLAIDSPWLRPVPLANYNAHPIPGQSLKLVEGDRFKGTYEATFTFPEGVLSGSWQFIQRIEDSAGNQYVPPERDAIDSIGFYLNIDSHDDMTPPTMSITMDKTILDISDGPASVNFTVNVQDLGVGLPATATWSTNGYSFPNTSSNPQVATFVGKIEYAKLSADRAYDSRGRRTLSIDLPDGNGNGSGSRNIGEHVVASRPVSAKRPTIRPSEGGLSAVWVAPPDVLEIVEYETDFSGANFARTVNSVGTEASLTGIPSGTYTARVRARNQLGWGEWTALSTPVAYTLAPMASSTPVVSGTPKVGQTLTANPGTWTPGATLAYRWLAGGIRVSGATGSTLVLNPSQSGKAIAVRVTGSKPGYETVSKTSALTAAVAKGALAGATPTIKGTARVGSTLTAISGTWSPAPVALSYQWHRSGVAIVGATASTYRLAAADLGKAITVRATARKSGYNVAGRTSRATAPVATNVLTAPRPIIPSTATVGQTLTAKTGIWSPAGVTLTYQWNRNGSPIPGATASSYKAISADAGSALSIRVTGRKSGYLVKATTSRATAFVAK